MNIRRIVSALSVVMPVAWGGTAFAQQQPLFSVCGPDIQGNPVCTNIISGQQTVAGRVQVAVGSGSGVLNSATNGTAVGPNAQVNGVNGSAFGFASQAPGAGATAVGASSLSSGAGSVALGQGSDDGGRAGVVSVGSVPSILQPGGLTRQIINVAAGTVAFTSTDAVNGSQLFAVQQLASQAAVGANAVQYDNAARTSVTLNSGGASAQLHNVGAGGAGTDAANVAQLTAALNNAVASAQGYTDQRFNALSGQISGFASQVGDLSSRITKVSRDADAGTAAAIASSNIPQAVTGGRTTLGGAVGGWNGEAAFAIGASHLFEGSRLAVRGSANFDSRGSTGGGVGFGVSF